MSADHDEQAVVVDAFAEAADGVAIPDGDAASLSTGFVGEDAVSSDVAGHVTPPQPWDNLRGPFPSGFVYDDLRSILRVQRGKPKGNVSISCYKHSACSFLVTEARAPPDIEIFRWLFEEPASARDASSAERKAAARRHIALAKEKWSAPRGGGHT